MMVGEEKARFLICSTIYTPYMVLCIDQDIDFPLDARVHFVPRPPKQSQNQNQMLTLTLTLTLMLTHCAAGGPPTGTVVILPAWRQLQQWVVPLLQKPRLANLVLP